MINKNQQKDLFDSFPNLEEIKKIMLNFPVELTVAKEKDIKKSYEHLILYVREKVEMRDKNQKLYACQYFLTPLRKQLFSYYEINKNLLNYYYTLYVSVLPVLPDKEKDIPFITWLLKSFYIKPGQMSVSQRFSYLNIMLNLSNNPEKEEQLYKKIKNFNVIFKFLVFDLIDSSEIMTHSWIKSFKKIIPFQLKNNMHNIFSYHFLFNLICIVATYNFSLILEEKDSQTEGIKKSDLKEYITDVFELLDLLINSLDVRPAHMLHKYLLIIIIASRCMSDNIILDDILQQNTKFQLELKLQLFDLIGISKELDSIIKSLRESMWVEDNISNNIHIVTLASQENYTSYRQRLISFVDKKIIISRQFLNDIDYQKYMMRSVINIFLRDKTKYDINKQILFISLFKSLLKVNIASLDNLFNIIMQTIFCWSKHFIFEWELIFEFFESRREMFKKNRFYFSYLYQLVDMFNNGDYHGDIKLFEYHYMQWEDLPNDEAIQKLYIDFEFKTPYMMITELPKKLQQCKNVKFTNDIISYFFQKVGNVYENGKNNEKLNEAIVKYFLPFFDLVFYEKDLLKEWEKNVFIIIRKINDEDVDLIKKIFDYIKSKIIEVRFFSVDFIKELIHYSWKNNYINKLNHVNSTLECLIETIHININELNVEKMSRYIENILNIVNDFSYTCNNEIICGPIQQRNNMSLWKINYKLSYEQNETKEFIIFSHQKLFGVLIAVISQNKINATLKVKILKYIHELISKNPFFLININLSGFYNYALSTISATKIVLNRKDLELILSIVNDLAYIIPATHCHPLHKIPPYYFSTQEFQGKKDIKRKSIESLITLSVSILEQIQKTSTQVPQSEPITIEFNGGVVDCGDSEEITMFYSSTLSPDNIDETIDINWKYIGKLLDCISFQLHSFLNYGAYNVNNKYKNTYNPYTLFKYLQTKASVKSSSIREQEIRVVLDNLIQKLLNPIRVLLTNEKSVHVDLISFSLYKLLYHNLELFSVFNDISMQVIHLLISLSWSKYFNEVTFKYGTVFPEIRKLTPVKKNFLVEPNLFIKTQINSLICSFAELSSNGEKLCDMLIGILNKKKNDADKTPKEVVQMFLDTLEWHVAIKRKRDAYYNLRSEVESGDTFGMYKQLAETAFVSENHRVVFTKLDTKTKSNFDVLIYSPFSNSQMHLKMLTREKSKEDGYRTFNKLDKEINKFICAKGEEENEIVYEDDTISKNNKLNIINNKLGCSIDIQDHLSNKGYQFQSLYVNNMRGFLPLHDVNAMFAISNLSSALNEVPVNFFCNINIFYYCPISIKNSYTNSFLLFISSLTGLKVKDLQEKLSQDLPLIFPTQNNQIVISVYNNKESLEKIQKNKQRKTSSFSKLDKSISIVWVDNSNYINKPSYVSSNEKLFIITIYAFSSQYFTVETKVNENNPYAPLILTRFNMLFQEINIINSNETFKTLTNFLTKHIHLLCTIVIDKKLTSIVSTMLDESPDTSYITSMYLPKEDNVYFRYKLINSKKSTK